MLIFQYARINANYVVEQDRAPLLPAGSYLKMDESTMDDLLGQEPLRLGDVRAQQWELRAASKQDGQCMCVVCTGTHTCTYIH